MIVKKIRLRNFRNYQSAEMIPDPGMNLITGPNAQGKTNLLESLVYLSLTRSHRITDDKKLIRQNAMFADIACTYLDRNEKEIQAIIHPDGKTLRVYQQPVKKSSEFIGLLNVVLFSPDDLRIFNDAPSSRRKVINQEIAKVSSKYLQALSRYNAVLRERNQLLKNQRVDDRLLDTLDEQLSQAEYIILQERFGFVQKMNRHITTLYQKLADDQIHVSVVYRCYLEGECTVANILETRRKARANDLFRHSTTTGCHRDDLIFMMQDVPLVQIASQGQRRMAMLSFKMALLRYIQEQSGKEPILLLDDVLSELDYHRQSLLLEMVKDSYQCFITSTEIPPFLKEKQFAHFIVRNGMIERVQEG